MSINKSQEAIKAKEFVQQFFDKITKENFKQLQEYFNSLGDLEKQKSIINSTTEGRGRSAIHFAAARGDIQIFDFIYDLTQDKEKEDEEGNTALFIAVQHDLFQLIKHLANKQYNFQKSRKGNVGLLHLAAINGNLQLIDYLLQKNLNIDQVSDDLGTPLEWAVAYNQANVIDFLFRKGAKISQAQYDGAFPPPLHLAINSNNQEIIDLLIKLDQNCIFDKDRDGWNTLQTAAEVGNLKVCEFLSQKLDPNYKVKGKTALDLAFQYDRWDCVNYLKTLTIYTELNKDLPQEEFKQATKEEQDQALKFKDNGNKYFQDKDYENAILQYTQGINLDQKNEILYSNRAASYLFLNKYEEALKDAQISIKLNPKYAKAYFREGDAYFKIESYQEAAGSYWEALKLEPENQNFKYQFKLSVKLGKQKFNNKN